MRARNLLEGAQYDPETLHLIFEAFDAAWSEIAAQFDPANAREVERARTRLAHAILVVASDKNDDAERIKRDALRVMALAYRVREL